MNEPDVASTNPSARSLLAAALETTVDSIPPEARIADLKGFDSLAYERLIAATEQHLGRDLPPFALVSVETVEDFQKLLDGKLTPMFSAGA